MNPRREEKAISWATWHAQEKAKKDVWWPDTETAIPAPLTFAELGKVAREYSVRCASDYTRAFDIMIDGQEYAEWEAVFIKTFVGAYATTVVAELEKREKREAEEKQGVHIPPGLSVSNALNAPGL